MSAVLAEFGFELNGRLVSDRGVEVSPIVDLVDEDADVASRLLDCFARTSARTRQLRNGPKRGSEEVSARRWHFPLPITVAQRLRQSRDLGS
jgi:hypothetical protein